MYKLYLNDDRYLEQEMLERYLSKEEIKEVKTSKFNRSYSETYIDHYVSRIINIVDEVLTEYEGFKFGRIDLNPSNEKDLDEDFYKELFKLFSNHKRYNIFNDILYRYIWKIGNGEEGKTHVHMGLFWREDVNPIVMEYELKYYLCYLAKKHLGEELNVYVCYNDIYKEYFKNKIINKKNKYGVNSCLLLLRYLCKDDGGVSKDGYRDFGCSSYRIKDRRYDSLFFKGFPIIGEYAKERDKEVVRELRHNNQYQRLRDIDGSLRMCHIEEIREDIGYYSDSRESSKEEVGLYLRIELMGNGMDLEDRVEELDLSRIADDREYTLYGSMGDYRYRRGRVYREGREDRSRVLSEMDSSELLRYWESLKIIVSKYGR